MAQGLIKGIGVKKRATTYQLPAIARYCLLLLSISINTSPSNNNISTANWNW